jgi:hypothetical protein
LGSTKRQGNIKKDLKNIRCETVYWIHVAASKVLPVLSPLTLQQPYAHSVKVKDYTPHGKIFNFSLITYLFPSSLFTYEDVSGLDHVTSNV